MRQNYKMILQYEGTRYNGWQRQGNTADTIQGKLEAVLGRMAGEPVEIHGSGRTDAGVHASGQVANFYLPEELEIPQIPESAKPENMKPEGMKQESAKHARTRRTDQIREYLNFYLPEDIAVLSVEEVSERFHSRLNAVRKIYAYRIETGSRKNVFLRRTIYGLGQPLDVEAMEQAALLLIGTHDFKSFCGNKKMKKSTVRTIYSIDIRQEFGNSGVTLRFTGNGFLQNMVRILTGTLIEVGLHKRSWQSVHEILEAKDRQMAGFTAPAEGLCLEHVFYS